MALGLEGAAKNYVPDTDDVFYRTALLCRRLGRSLIAMAAGNGRRPREIGAHADFMLER